MADPNFDLVRKSVSEIVDGLGQWLGRRTKVDWAGGPCREEGDGTGPIQCGKTRRAVLDSAGSRDGVGGVRMAGLAVAGVAIVFAVFL